MATPSLPRFVAVPAPVAPRFGLESVVNWSDNPDPKTFMGVEFEPGRCDAARLINGLSCFDNDAESPEPRVFSNGVDRVLVSPFAVYGEYQCNPIGRSDEEAFERARQHLASGSGRAIERAIQFGEPGNEPTLSSEAVEVGPGSAVGTVEAVALLEQYLGENYGGVGVLHMDRRLATHAIAEGLVFPDGSQLRTGLGTLVAAGAGYESQSGPDESPESPGDGALWIYATGAVHGWRSAPVESADGASFDRDYNLLTVVVEQLYVIGWECVTAAVQVEPVGAGS
jgi:hypothetical protein